MTGLMLAVCVVAVVAIVILAGLAFDRHVSGGAVPWPWCGPPVSEREAAERRERDIREARAALDRLTREVSPAARSRRP